MTGPEVHCCWIRSLPLLAPSIGHSQLPVTPTLDTISISAAVPGAVHPFPGLLN